MTPELKLRNNHGVTGLHREFYQVLQHMFMASDLVWPVPLIDTNSINRSSC